MFVSFLTFRFYFFDVIVLLSSTVLVLSAGSFYDHTQPLVSVALCTCSTETASGYERHTCGIN